MQQEIERKTDGFLSGFNAKSGINGICGIVMPISGSAEYSEEHWRDVKTTISDVIESCGFVPKLVSEEDVIGVIHSRIVNNLFENPMVVCDVSSKNPNVMLELGMRLAFNKPTIIIQDEKTTFTYDTGPIEHLIYPESLNKQKLKAFEIKLATKLTATYNASVEDDFMTFLKHFLSPKNFEKSRIPDKTTIEKLQAEVQQLRSIMKNMETDLNLQSKNYRHKRNIG